MLDRFLLELIRKDKLMFQQRSYCSSKMKITVYLLKSSLTPTNVIQCRSPFQLGWYLSHQDVTHVLWDWYDNTVDALRLLSEIKTHPHLSDLCVIGFIPSYEQLNPSFLLYFDEKTTKNLALQNLRIWIGDL